MSNSLFLHELIHLVLSLLAISITWLFFLQKKYRHTSKYISVIILGGLLGGVFLDSDHLFDYIISFGLIFRPDYFLTGHMFAVSNRVFVPVHSWELVFIFGVISYVTKNKMAKYFLTALALGMITHLVFDTYSNRTVLLGYSFIYRLLTNFDAGSFSALM